MDLGGLLQGVESSSGNTTLPAALAIFVQEAGVPLPLPVGGVLLVLGYRATSQPSTLLAASIVLVELATLLGVSIKYWFGLKGGRPLLYTYGRYLRLEAGRLRRSEGQFRQHDTKAVVIGRIVPGVSMITPLVAGALGMPYRRFLPAAAAGSTLNIVVFTMLGFWAGPSVIGRLIRLGLSLRVMATVALILAVVAAILVFRRRRLLGDQIATLAGGQTRIWDRALISGLLAMFEMGVGINLMLYVTAVVGLLAPERALVRFLELTARLAGGSTEAFVVLIVLFIAGGLLWSLLYTLFGVRLLPGPAPVRGLLFSALPFAASMGLLWVLGFGPLGLGLGAGLIPFAGELTRCGIFGVGLGTAEEMVRRASSSEGSTDLVEAERPARWRPAP